MSTETLITAKQRYWKANREKLQKYQKRYVRDDGESPRRKEWVSMHEVEGRGTDKMRALADKMRVLVDKTRVLSLTEAQMKVLLKLTESRQLDVVENVCLIEIRSKVQKALGYL